MDGRTLNPMKRTAEALSDVLSDMDNYNHRTFDENKIRISFDGFSKILRTRGVCLDLRTIKSKWDILIGQTVLTDYGSKQYDRAFFSIPTFNAIYGELGVREISTHTIISASTGVGQASDHAHTQLSQRVA